MMCLWGMLPGQASACFLGYAAISLEKKLAEIHQDIT
jgi:hypothetical protein